MGRHGSAPGCCAGGATMRAVPPCRPSRSRDGAAAASHGGATADIAGTTCGSAPAACTTVAVNGSPADLSAGPATSVALGIAAVAGLFLHWRERRRFGA
jgi:hypothetical protein